MNPLGPLDIIDPSNIGGREQLMNRMFNHQTALLTIKPTIDIRKGPRPHVDAKKLHKDKPKYKKLLEYGNVFNTFNAVQNTKKGLIDSKEPQTLNLTYLWGNKPRSQKFLMKEHQKNIDSQIRHIKNMGTIQERKKNPNDPLAHPTYLFKNDENELKKTNNYLLKQILKPQKRCKTVNEKKIQTEKQIKKEENNEFLVQNNKHQIIKKDPFIHNQKAQIITKEEYDIYKKEFLKKNHGSYLFDDDFGDEIPKVKGNLQEDYDIIKQKLVFLIVKYRIYKEEDIEVLFARTTVHNRHLKMEKLDEIFILIKDELNK